MKKYAQPEKTIQKAQKKRNNKKISLYPLDFDEALKTILLTPPEKKQDLFNPTKQNPDK